MALTTKFLLILFMALFSWGTLIAGAALLLTIAAALA